jgi:hypothetical protein
MALRLRPEAREDLDAAARWYEAQENGLGRQFLADPILGAAPHTEKACAANLMGNRSEHYSRLKPFTRLTPKKRMTTGGRFSGIGPPAIARFPQAIGEIPGQGELWPVE